MAAPATQNDCFVWAELKAALEERKEQERQVEEISREVQLEFRRIQLKSKSRQQFAENMQKLKEKALKRHQKVVFGVDDPHARQKYLNKYGCCAWTAGALRTIKMLKVKVLEIGAGQGHWQRAMSDSGIDCRAYDNFEGGFSVERSAVGKVELGDEHVIPEHVDRTLFLCCPPPGDMALRCLRQYKGEILIYVGEGRGGAHANGDFFDEVLSSYSLEKVIELKPFPRCHEKLFIFRR